MGPESAVVTGPAGQEIYTNEHGQVKVQFHWDRYGKKDENSSCWVRVSQPWAGKGWGAVAIPRIGQEVIVDFLEGDPDQPIIVGRFYNGESMPPYALPAGAVVSGLKTNTHKGKGYNEMSMNDTAGKEMITIHGQYDMCTTVLHDQSTTVNNNRTDTIDVDDSETVGSNQTQSIGANQSISVGANRDETVGGTETLTIGGHRTETVNGGETVTVNGGRTHTVNGVQSTTISVAETHTVGAGRMHNVGAGEMIDVGGAQMVNIGGAQMVNVGSLHKVNVGGPQSFSVGGPHKLAAAVIGETSKGPIKIKAGAVCMVEAPTIVLKAGGSKIIMNSSGITMKGAKITITADGSASFKAGGSIKIKGANLGED
jgi:type VI secretion system secreted protein VgrG